jgi:transposase
MPTPRRFGQKVDGNARRGPNISPTERQRIIAKREAGVTVRELAAEFGRSESAIKYTIRTYTKTATTEERPRTGRPRILSRHQEKIIYRIARAAPKIEYSELAKQAVFVNSDGTATKLPSHSTLYRVLKRRSLTKLPCKKRPKLTAVHARKRRRFCRGWVRFQWHRRTVKFSDECSVQKSSGANPEWAFRFSWEKWKKEMLTECSTSRKPAQMVWGSIWLDERGHPRRSKLVIMERDPDAPRGGYSAKSYIETLTKGLLPHYRRSQQFMHDNAGIHRARKVQEFIRRHRIRVINWPPYSPDLNPVEHMWWVLKKMMYKHYPQYNNLNQAEEEWDRFCEALQECWRRIPGALIKRLITSMSARIRACKKAKGYQTKY